MQLALTTAEHLDDALSDERVALGLEGAIDGPYTIVRRLGEGGMGVVYLAEQTRPIRRFVVIKIARAVLGSRQEIARLESERQALASASGTQRRGISGRATSTLRGDLPR
jgi:serine/threonine protein kinase